MKIVIALLIFGIIVFIHEFGHFIVAKKSDIFVEEFAIGMGPQLFSFVKGETKYSIRLLPLGGFCRMRGEDEASDDDRAFNNKSLAVRFAVVFAGPFFNFILAFVLAVVLIALVGADVPKILTVAENSPAVEAGLKEGDQITSYNGYTIGVGREIYISDYFKPVSDAEIPMTYMRDGQKYDTTLKPSKQKKYYLGMSYSNTADPAEIKVVADGAMEKAGMKDGDIITKIGDTEIATGEELYAYVNGNEVTAEPVEVTYSRDGNEETTSITPIVNEIYVVGFTYNSNYSDCNEKVGILGNLKYSLLEVRYQIKTVILSLKHMIMGKVSADSVAGPVGIVNMVGDVYSESVSYGWLVVFESLSSFCIMLSANLGVMNLLPIPALDGGRLLFMIVELIRGKKIDEDKEGFFHFIGFVLLMVLMVVILFNDIRNIFF